jgi:hypothetical protein
MVSTGREAPPAVVAGDLARRSTMTKRKTKTGTALVLRIGNATHRVASIEEASATFVRLCAQSERESDWPGPISGRVGDYEISYNGRVWLGKRLAYDPYQIQGRRYAPNFDERRASMCDPHNDPSSLLDGGAT